MTREGEPDSGDGGRARTFDALLDEFLERHRRGDGPRIDEYVQRYPDLAERIRECFPGALVLEHVRDSVTPGGAGEGAGLVRPGEYRILRELGRGGMGIVYEAEQPSLHRRVALKALLPAFGAGTRGVERFRREAQAAARLRHPGILPIYEFGDHGGIEYYAMQLVEGANLQEVLGDVRSLTSNPDLTSSSGSPGPDRDPRRTGELSATIALRLLGGSSERAGPESPSPVVPGRHPPFRALGGEYFAGVARIGHRIAGALAYAHGEGVLHRDIKPSNILLDANGNAWLADFGLARAGEPDGLTRSGEILGTLRYMAPERFRGISDHRSDIYALGATLYELATLRPVFDDEDRPRLIKRIAEEPPVSPRTIQPAIPRDLESIVLTAMTKDLEERYQTASEMERDLERFLERSPIVARGPSAVRLARRRARRHAIRWLSVAAAIALGLLLALVLKERLLPRGSPRGAQRRSLGVTYRAGAGTTALVAADLNADGRPDLAAANYGSGTVSILLGVDAGEPSEAVGFPVGCKPYSLWAGDLDGDGIPDLLVACREASVVSWLRNGGDGTFEGAIAMDVAGGPTCAAAADVTGDGVPDLVVASADVPRLSVLAGKGWGDFEPWLSYGLGGPAWALAIGDLDGDPHVDAAVAGGPDQVWTFRGDGSGGFGSPETHAVGSYPTAILIADLDGDGLSELATADGGLRPAIGDRDTVSILYRRGDHDFGPPTLIPAGDRARALVAADLDLDGDLDLAVANEHSGEVILLLAGAGGAFAASDTIAAGLLPHAIAAKDLDGDRDPDLIVASFGSGTLTVLENGVDGGSPGAAFFQTGAR